MNLFLFKLRSTTVYIPHSNHNLTITKHIGFSNLFKNKNIFLLHPKILSKYPLLINNSTEIIMI